MASCLRLAIRGSAILLIGEGVYHALADLPGAASVVRRMEDFSFFVLGPDLTARGLEDSVLIEGLEVVDYEGFVDLVATHGSTQSW